MMANKNIDIDELKKAYELNYKTRCYICKDYDKCDTNWKYKFACKLNYAYDIYKTIKNIQSK